MLTTSEYKLFFRTIICFFFFLSEIVTYLIPSMPQLKPYAEILNVPGGNIREQSSFQPGRLAPDRLATSMADIRRCLGSAFGLRSQWRAMVMLLMPPMTCPPSTSSVPDNSIPWVQSPMLVIQAAKANSNTRDQNQILCFKLRFLRSNYLQIFFLRSQNIKCHSRQAQHSTPIGLLISSELLKTPLSVLYTIVHHTLCLSSDLTQAFVADISTPPLLIVNADCFASEEKSVFSFSNKPPPLLGIRGNEM